MTSSQEKKGASLNARESVHERFDELICAIKRNVDLDGLLHPALAMLAEYDEANQSDLLHTLDVYLENDCNAQKCGRLLFLHRNSLVYRVRRIQEITGCDLSDPLERNFLRLSFALKPE